MPYKLAKATAQTKPYPKDTAEAGTKESQRVKKPQSRRSTAVAALARIRDLVFDRLSVDRAPLGHTIE